MNSTIVTEHKCGSLSVGVDAADTALKCMLPGGENENGANGQQKGREGPNARAGEHNDRKASHSATTLLAGGAAATTRCKFNMFPCTQLRITRTPKTSYAHHQRRYYTGRASRSGKTF
jgi:hypothetical protein